MMDYFVKILRKVGDSNPRYACAYTAFRVRLFRPLRQLSLNRLQRYTFFLIYANIRYFFFEKILFSTHFAQDSQGTRNRFYLLDHGVAFASWFALSIFVFYHTAALRTRVDKLNDFAECI